MRLGRSVVLAMALIAAGAAAAEAMFPWSDRGGLRLFPTVAQPPAVSPGREPNGARSLERTAMFPTVDPGGFSVIHG